MNTKRSLFTSCISLLLCFVMLVSTTFAWFTDIAVSSDNVIQAGNLDIALMKGTPDGNGGWTWTENSGEAIFDYDKWEPGYTTWAALAVENHGTLAARWQAQLTLNGTPSILADVIEVYSTYDHLFDSTSRPDFEDGTWRKMGTVRELLENDGLLMSGDFIEPGHRQPIVIALHMREDAGNEYQGLNLGANFDIKILATQASFENDSFGNDYDADAKWPDEAGFETTASLDNVATVYGELANDFIIRYSDTVYALLPAGVKLADGVDSLKFSGKSVDNANITLGDGDSAKSYDIHIEGIADDNNVAITVYLGPILDKNISDTSLKLYHEDALMTRVNSVSDFATNNQYTYDPATGDLVIYVDNFSVFSSILTYADKWDGTSDTTWYNENDTEFTLTTAKQFAGFRDLVDGGNTFAGKTVKLGVDIDLTRIPFDPIGFGYYNAETNTRVFMGTFDGGNHTIYNLYENCWELDPDKTNYSTYTYSTAGAGLFASIKDATIKNLAISGAEIVFECVDMGVLVGYAQGECHFENIVVTDSNIANYNRYTGGLVGEVSYGPYGIDTTKGYSHTFKNITIDSTVKVSGLWGSFGCGMGGVIGGKWGDATVKMENVVSAAEMDVYNDVVSAYQWYAFRGCGMLIGHTEEPYSDGRHSGNATASFLTCENVKVYYGDWVNQNYYRFDQQTDAEGNPLWYSNYPWVRAEKGEYCDAFSNIRYGIPQINGVKVTEIDGKTAEELADDHVVITFDQLYGADQGMYGTATHEGVTVFKKNVKTVYIHNNASWTNLKLDYWYKHGEDTWTNLLESIALSPVQEGGEIYKLEIPTYVDSFKITGAENKEVTFRLVDVANNGFYTLEGTHEHDFSVDNTCICRCVKATVVIATYADGKQWSDSTKYKSVVVDKINITAEGGGNTGKYYINGENWRLYGSENAQLIISAEDVQIISVTITYKTNIDKDVVAKLLLNGSHIVSGETVDVNAESVTFDVENKVGIESIDIIYSATLVCAHESIITDTVAPTCTEAGYTAKKCGECGKIIEKEIGEKATGHQNTTETTVDATCTEAGSTIVTCDDCGATVSITEIPAIDHNYVDGICTGCGAAEPTEPETPTGSGWIKTDLADIKATDVVVIVWTKDNTSWALSNDKGTSAAPAAVVVTVEGDKLSGDIAENIKWNISYTNGELTIYPNGTTATWLYCTSTNNGVRVGTNANKVFTIDASSGYLKHTGTSRYLGVYTTAPDVRCYTNTTGNTANQTIAFYKYNAGTSGSEPTCEHTNTTTTTVNATCTEAGSVTVTCNDCSETVSTEIIDALGHNYVDGVCNREGCGEEEPTKPELTEKTYSYTFTASQYSANGEKTLNGIKWTLAGDGGYWGYDGTKGQQFGSGNKPYTELTFSSDSFSNVSKIVINTSGASDIKGTLKVYVGDKLVNTITLTKTATEYSIDVGNLSGVIKFEYTQTSSKALYIKSISVEYAE